MEAPCRCATFLLFLRSPLPSASINVDFPRTQVHILNSQTRILFYSTLIFKSKSNHITLDRVYKSSEKGVLSMSDTKFTEMGETPAIVT
jgi:hypothetical protein